MIRTRLAQTITLALALLASGCSIGTSTPSRFYLPVPLAESPAKAQAAGEGTERIGIGPLHLAPYLDRPQIVTRGKGVRLSLAEFDRWAEPLDESIIRTLAENVSRRLGNSPVDVFPWRDQDDIGLNVALEIGRLDGEPGGEAIIEGWFTVIRKGEPLRTYRFAHRTPAGGDYESLVLALSTLLDRLGADIAATL